MKKLLVAMMLLVCLCALVACRPEKTPSPNPDSNIERTNEPETYPPTNIVPGVELDEPAEIE